jgi:RNase P/RNase MRP subunit POP5
MLKRRYKRRYVSVMHDGGTNDALNAITKRFCELFGSVATEKAAIRLMRSNTNEAIIRCRLEQLDNLLVAIALSEPPVVATDISGSIKRIWLRRNNASRQEKPFRHHIKR